jgi:hypothetical protein
MEISGARHIDCVPPAEALGAGVVFGVFMSGVLADLASG